MLKDKAGWRAIQFSLKKKDIGFGSEIRVALIIMPSITVFIEVLLPWYSRYG